MDQHLANSEELAKLHGLKAKEIEKLEAYKNEEKRLREQHLNNVLSYTMLVAENNQLREEIEEFHRTKGLDDGDKDEKVRDGTCNAKKTSLASWWTATFSQKVAIMRSKFNFRSHNETKEITKKQSTITTNDHVVPHKVPREGHDDGIEQIRLDEERLGITDIEEILLEKEPHSFQPLHKSRSNIWSAGLQFIRKKINIQNNWKRKSCVFQWFNRFKKNQVIPFEQ